MHKAMFSCTKSALIHAVNKGHMNQKRQNIRSTKKKLNLNLNLNLKTLHLKDQAKTPIWFLR
jgi:hypothetical protein